MTTCSDLVEEVLVDLPIKECSSANPKDLLAPRGLTEILDDLENLIFEEYYTSYGRYLYDRSMEKS